MSTVFVLGPSLENVIEPPAVPVSPGRRGVEFGVPATSPGGIVHLVLAAVVVATDALPVNVYAFYCHPPSGVPVGDERTPDWFFKNAGANGSVATGHAPEAFDIVVPGVLPGVYHVQIVLEYPA